jgi:hypothetical protein
MNSVTAIIDARAPQKAIETLQQYCDVFLFRSENITYDAISCHPDIFLFQGKNKLIVAPNAPQDLIATLHHKGISFMYGNSEVGKELNNSTYYNCIETHSHLFHKQEFTDKVILESTKKKTINLPQAYTRCSMIALNEKAFITSDKGIEKVLLHNGFECFYVNPSTIRLPPYKHGFIGGCMGIFENRLFVIGSLESLENGDELRQFIQQQKLEIIELYNDNLYDGGGIFFL